MTEYRLSNRADGDLAGIYLYGLEQFGFAQAERYQESMSGCFAMLATHPKIGRSATGIRLGLRRHEHGSHVIFYKEEQNYILIVAVIHGRSVRMIEL